MSLKLFPGGMYTGTTPCGAGQPQGAQQAEKLLKMLGIFSKVKKQGCHLE